MFFEKNNIIYGIALDELVITNRKISSDQGFVFYIIRPYCFTSDNIIKMILILLRIRAGIHIVMLGETGYIKN